SATTSPARTRLPFSTLMAASWPPTSGATRISVARTTPTTGATCPECHRIYAPAPAATSGRPSAPMRPRLAMHPPPLDKKRGHHRERAIADRLPPQPTPIVPHLPQARPQLVHANDAVDREVGREDVARREHRFGDRFARPGEAGEEELRHAGAEEDEHRRLRALEPGAHRLTHEAGRENEQRREHDQLQRIAERGKAVEARQHDEIQPERRQVDA